MHPVDETSYGRQRSPRWRRVLVFHIGSLGDTVLSVPALTAVRTHIGVDARVDLLHNDGVHGRVTPPDVIPDGLVDRFWTFPTRESGSGIARARATRTLLAELRNRRYDAVINLTLADRTDRQLLRDRAFFHLCGQPELIGFDTAPPDLPEVQIRLGRIRNAGIQAELGDGPWIIPNQQAQDVAQRWRADVALAPATSIVTMAPGTLMPAKRWPFDHWKQLGRRVLDRGLHPVIVGGPTDRYEARRLIDEWSGGDTAAGDLSPAGSAALIRSAEVHVGVDSGTSHLAAAVGTPLVALYSHRVPPSRWSPMGPARILDHPVTCAGCAHTECPVTGHPCMAGITVDAVWDQITASLDEGGTPTPFPPEHAT